MLELININFTFNNKSNLLNNLSMDLKKGAIYALMGANGSGKTTLFNIISGFHKQSSGNIIFKDKKIDKMLPFQRSLMGIGRTFQDLRIITKLTVFQNILLAMKDNPGDLWYKSILPSKFNERQIKFITQKATEILETYKLADVRNNPAGEISFGQQKLLTLACCATNDAELLMLDEPIAGINPEFMKIIRDLLVELKAQDKTILFVEHNSDFIVDTADEIFFLNQGKLKSYRNIYEMSEDSYVKEAYL